MSRKWQIIKKVLLVRIFFWLEIAGKTISDLTWNCCRNNFDLKLWGKISHLTWNCWRNYLWIEIAEENISEWKIELLCCFYTFLNLLIICYIDSSFCSVLFFYMNVKFLIFKTLTFEVEPICHLLIHFSSCNCRQLKILQTFEV